MQPAPCMPNFTPAAHFAEPHFQQAPGALRCGGRALGQPLLSYPCHAPRALQEPFGSPVPAPFLAKCARDLRLGTPKAEAAASLLQGFCLPSARGGAGGTRRWLGPSLQGEGRWVPPIPAPLAGLVNHQAPLRSVLSAWLCYGNIDLLLGLTSQSFQWAGLTVINETGWNLC